MFVKTTQEPIIVFKDSVNVNRVNRMGSRTSLALWIYLFCICTLTCCWCWRHRSTTEEPLVVWKWQPHPMKWAARVPVVCYFPGHPWMPAESNGKVTSFLLLAVSVTLYAHWTLSMLSWTDENIFYIDSMGNILILWADLVDKTSRFCQKQISYDHICNFPVVTVC